jgi:hypothetical protein
VCQNCWNLFLVAFIGRLRSSLGLAVNAARERRAYTLVYGALAGSFGGSVVITVAVRQSGSAHATGCSVFSLQPISVREKFCRDRVPVNAGLSLLLTISAVC